MFRPAPMVQINALVLQRDERALLYGLGQVGVVHLARTDAGPQTAPQAPPDKSPELGRCDDLLRRMEALQQGDESDSPPLAEEIVAIPLDRAEERLQIVEQQVHDLTERHSQLEQRWSQVTILLDQLGTYSDLDLPLEQIRQSSFLHFAIGSLPAKNLEGLREDTADNVVLIPLEQKEARQPVVAMTSRKGRFAMETALKQAGFRHEKPPVKEGSDIAAIARESREEQTRLTEQLDSARQQQETLMAELAPELERLKQAVREERAILEAQEHFPHTDTAVLISGWIPADQATNIVDQLKDVTGDRCVVRIKQPDDVPVEEIPILLRQPRWLQPFTSVVTGYGLPGYRDVEPTLFVAISYMLMFGIMFGDVGHGGLLAIGGLGTMFFAPQRKLRDMGLIVFMAGASSALFGVVYGSYFGIPQLHHYALWHDPLHEPVGLMIATVGVGIAIISLGAILNTINALRRGELITALLDKFGLVGVIFYWGSLVFLVKYSTLSELGLAGICLVLLVVLPLTALALKEPLEYALARRAGRHTHSDNFFMACIESAIEAFEAVLAYLANTISFVRLAAYAMSHAAILMATFAVADAVGDVPAVGGVLYILIAILGNAIAFVLEGVVVAVQVLRLEYYEFFGKFFSGDGLPYRPFSFLGKGREVT